ncbi:hypothetical protein [Actinopolyspora xinjiangensis]|uniref:hypothetical protein n=1 Tax=Actinopolyspora xinjiangensis TaxID=405564 RepID=UPI00147D35A8|nr:hypothetical protein [Actinopolyspora xinjiangensis]
MSSSPRYGAETPLPGVITPLLHRSRSGPVQRLDRDLVVATAELAELVLRGHARLRGCSGGSENVGTGPPARDPAAGWVIRPRSWAGAGGGVRIRAKRSSGSPV